MPPKRAVLHSKAPPDGGECVVDPLEGIRKAAGDVERVEWPKDMVLSEGGGAGPRGKGEETALADGEAGAGRTERSKTALDTVGYWQAAYLNLLHEVVQIRNDMVRAMSDLDDKHHLTDGDGWKGCIPEEGAWRQYCLLDDLADRAGKIVEQNLPATGLQMEMEYREELSSHIKYRALHLVPRTNSAAGRRE